MRRIFPLIMLLMTGAVVAPARADLTHRMTSSTQLSVNGAYTDASRIGSTYTVSGSNIKVTDSGHFGKMTAATATAAAAQDVGEYDINTAGSAFSFSESWTQGDVVNPIGTGVDVTAGVVADMPVRRDFNDVWWCGWNLSWDNYLSWSDNSNCWRGWHYGYWPIRD